MSYSHGMGALGGGGMADHHNTMYTQQLVSGVGAASSSTQSQQVTMDDIRFLDDMEAEERVQAQREMDHLPSHLRPDRLLQDTQSQIIGASSHMHSSIMGGSARDMRFPPDSVPPSQSSESTFGADSFVADSHAMMLRGRSDVSQSDISASQTTDLLSNLGSLADDASQLDAAINLGEEGDAEGAESSVTYDMANLPPHACKYCGIHTPASVVKCNICNKW